MAKTYAGGEIIDLGHLAVSRFRETFNRSLYEVDEAQHLFEKTIVAVVREMDIQGFMSRYHDACLWTRDNYFSSAFPKTSQGRVLAYIADCISERYKTLPAELCAGERA